MAEEASFPAGHRFSDDLRQIREDRGITVDEIHSETRIARTLIESFEEGALYDHPTYNRVYLRSFIKAYADAIEISRERALSALDAALEGTYQHELAQEYLSGEADPPNPDPPEEESPESSASEAPPTGPTAGGPEGRGGIVGPPRAVGEEPEEAEISMDDPPDDAATETGTSDSTSDEGDEEDEQSRDEEPAAASPLDSEDKEPEAPPSLEEAPDASSEAAGEDPDEDVVTDDSTTDDASLDEEAAEDRAADEEADESQEREVPDMTGPEALRSSPEEDEDAESDDQSGPAWLEEDPSDESPSGASGPPDADTPEPASMEGEVGSGIVGEPTEMGSGDSGVASGPARPSGGGAPPSGSAESGLADLLGDPSRRIVVTGAGIAVVIAVLIGLGVAYFSSESEQPAPTDTTAVTTSPASPDTSTAAPVDTAASDTTSTEQRPPPADVTLGETIYLMVLATDNVSGLRIQRDDDLRRPYWIEEGEASVYPFQRRAIIGSEFEDIRLFIAGHEYPFSPADTTDGLDLTRETLQAFVDTLRGTPTAPDVATDTIPVGPIEGASPAPEDTTLDETSSE